MPKRARPDSLTKTLSSAGVSYQGFTGKQSEDVNGEGRKKSRRIESQARGNNCFTDKSLCSRCATIDLDRMFSELPHRKVICKLGIVDQTWEKRDCSMCRLMAAVRPRDESFQTRYTYSVTPSETTSGDSGLQAGSFDTSYYSVLMTFSEHDIWLRPFDNYDLSPIPPLINRSDIPKDLATRVILGVVPVFERDLSHERAAETLPRSGFISCAKSSCNPYGSSNTLPVRDLKANAIDFGIIRDWLDCCRTKHSEKCNPKIMDPIRNLLLINCFTRQIVAPHTSVAFVALSYVWGRPSAETVKTEKGNYVENAETVIEDAMRITRELGYTHLWVDRYCIQESDKDKLHEQLRNMGILYQNAAVTLIAAAGEDASFGLPGARNHSRNSQPRAQVKKHLLLSGLTHPQIRIEQSMWASRGWTYQEALFSRRLVFTEEQVSFECLEMSCRESVELSLTAVDGNTRGSAWRSPFLRSWIFPLQGIKGC
ncbi:MAG: hypothetical protein MMC33_004046 [Icmadophila ericetorum]|nr:hypothetical protein [Icmadophila ericetorum]